jgi:hypothetical protein
MTGGFRPAGQNGGEAAEASAGLSAWRCGQLRTCAVRVVARRPRHRWGCQGGSRDADTRGRKCLNGPPRAKGRARGSHVEMVH